MKPANFFIAAVILGALVTTASDTAMAASAGKNNASQRGGKAAEHMSSKGSANTNAQWSADPEKGWVTASERHELQQKNGSSGKANENKGNQKGKNKGKKF